MFLELLKPQHYLDPGSGSILLQVLLAALLGAGFMLKVFWKRIRAIFGRKPDPEQDLDDENE